MDGIVVDPLPLSDDETLWRLSSLQASDCASTLASALAAEEADDDDDDDDEDDSVEGLVVAALFNDDGELNAALRTGPTVFMLLGECNAGGCCCCCC